MNKKKLYQLGDKSERKGEENPYTETKKPEHLTLQGQSLKRGCPQFENGPTHPRSQIFVPFRHQAF